MAEREVVVVTGVTGGVGRAVAQEFARHGAGVGLIARGRRHQSIVSSSNSSSARASGSCGGSASTCSGPQ
jgi:NAD(P)-dependent dehydrogenase (short-subunit alcohol dehydrogenase family)